MYVSSLPMYIHIRAYVRTAVETSNSKQKLTHIMRQLHSVVLSIKLLCVKEHARYKIQVSIYYYIVVVYTLL